MKSCLFSSAHTVRHVLEQVPAATPVFHGFGIDTCCGADMTLGQASAASGVSMNTLLEALTTASRVPGSDDLTQP